MKFLLAAALVMELVGQSGDALGYACNNNYYVNSSGHPVHSPSCGEEYVGSHLAVRIWDERFQCISDKRVI
jgi:hypothetical protein